MTQIALFLLLLVLVVSDENCVPFGLRIQYGNRMVSSASTEKMVIAFNTADICNLSYVTIFNKIGFTKVMNHPFRMLIVRLYLRPLWCGKCAAQSRRTLCASRWCQ